MDKQIKIQVEEQTHQAFKIKCIKAGKSMKDVIINFIKSY